jgi:ABC-type multidrug transport system ATPase subunit
VADPFIIETAELQKHYDGVEALRGLTLQVPAGSIYGFLGRNGAGKTTTIKVLLGMARPTDMTPSIATVSTPTRFRELQAPGVRLSVNPWRLIA